MPTTLKRLSFGLPTLVLGLNVLAFAPAFAEDGGSSGSSDTTTSSNETTTETSHQSGKPGRLVADTTETEGSDDSFRAQGEAQVAQLRKEHKNEQTDQERTKRCDAKKVGIENEFTKIASKEQSLHDKITDVYTKVTAFKTSKNLTVANYDTLVAAVDAAQTTSTASVAAVKADIPTIDCTKPDVATDIATFKAAATQARTDLKAYRSAVQSLLQAVKQAAAAAAGTGTTESTSDTTTKTTDTTTSGGTQ